MVNAGCAYEELWLTDGQKRAGGLSRRKDAKLAPADQKENGGAEAPPSSFAEVFPGSAQELQNALLRLVGERQRGGRDRLAGRQRLAVRRFLVRIGQRQVRRAGLQHVDQVLREVLTDLHHREVRTQGGSLRAQQRRSAAQVGDDLVGRGVVNEVGAADEVRQTETGRVEVDASDVQGRLAGLVERQLELIA